MEIIRYSQIGRPHALVCRSLAGNKRKQLPANIVLRWSQSRQVRQKLREKDLKCQREGEKQQQLYLYKTQNKIVVENEY